MSREAMIMTGLVLLIGSVGHVSAIDKYYWPTGDGLHLPGGVDWDDPNSWVESPSGQTPAGPPNDWTIDFAGGDYYQDAPGVNSGVVNINPGVIATPFRMVIGANKWPNYETYYPLGSGAGQPNPHGNYDVDAVDPLPEGVLNVYSIGDPDNADSNLHYGLFAHAEIAMGIQYPYGDGVLNVYGTAYGEGLRLAQAERSMGTVNVYDGGRLTIGWWGCWLGMDLSYNRKGVARINLKGTGSMTVWGDAATVADGMDGIQMYDNSHIDIEGGVIEVHGNHVDQLQGYIANGWITSYGGAVADCVPDVTHAVYSEGTPEEVEWTYLQSLGEGCPCKGRFKSDFDADCYVNLLDLNLFAQEWLKCTNAWDENCLPYLP